MIKYLFMGLHLAIVRQRVFNFEALENDLIFDFEEFSHQDAFQHISTVIF